MKTKRPLTCKLNHFTSKRFADHQFRMWSPFPTGEFCVPPRDSKRKKGFNVGRKRWVEPCGGPSGESPERTAVNAGTPGPFEMGIWKKRSALLFLLESWVSVWMPWAIHLAGYSKALCQPLRRPDATHEVGPRCAGSCRLVKCLAPSGGQTLAQQPIYLRLSFDLKPSLASASLSHSPDPCSGLKQSPCLDDPFRPCCGRRDIGCLLNLPPRGMLYYLSEKFVSVSHKFIEGFLYKRFFFLLRTENSREKLWNIKKATLMQYFLNKNRYISIYKVYKCIHYVLYIIYMYIYSLQTANS